LASIVIESGFAFQVCGTVRETPSVDERRAWADRAKALMDQRLARSDTIVILADRRYRELPETTHDKRRSGPWACE